jgi:two-component system, OmpR family, sensor histidine kinase CssS
MKRISQRITWPVIISSILIPLLIILVFNAVMRVYMLSTARRDLKETAAVTQSLIRQQMKSMDDSSAESDSMAARLASIQPLIRTTSNLSGTDLMLINAKKEIVFPAKISELGLSTRNLARLNRLFSHGLTAGRIETMATLNGQLLFLGYPLAESLPDRSLWVIYLIRYSPTRGMLLITNLILAGVLLAGSISSILLIRHTARRISKSLRQLCQFTDQVGGGIFPETKPDLYCQEVAELELQFNKMAQRLDHADKTQKTFLQNASHELRTPLQTIQGYAEGLEKGIWPDVPKAAGIIRAESRRLNQLVESLLTLYRIENQSDHPNLIRLNLANWLQDQLQRYRGLAASQDKCIEIRLLIPDADLVVLTDENLLGQAVANIMANAVRYARQVIRIIPQADAESVWLTFQDDGPGITPEDLPHLFERFYKGRNGQFGLGLAIAHSAVSALKGEMIAENSPDGGAIFRIGLPRANN